MMQFENLIQQPESRRDEAWETDFLTQFPGLKVQVVGEQAQAGPDGWPYLHVRTGPEGTEPVTEILRWLADKGIGLVVNAHKMVPDYVFTHGMLWNYVETGRFLAPQGEAARPGEVTYSPEGKVLVGAPSESYLPLYVRRVLKEFLAAQGFHQPKVLVISSADFKSVDLVLSVESIGDLPSSEHRKFAEMLAWFLPMHYTLVLGHEAGLPTFHLL